MSRPRNPLLQAPARPLPKRIALIGAGTIGPDIGYYLKSALPELDLVLVDVAQGALDRALARFTDYAAIRGADWVLEAATEDLALKQRIFAQVEVLVSADALITSNTSSLPAARIFSGLKHKGRATVTHFFAPAWRNPVVEVVRAREADPE